MLWSISLGVYLANGQTMTSSDAVPNSLILLNFLENHTFDLGRFVNAEAYQGIGPYLFIEGQNHRFSSIYPVGPAIVTAPIYLLFYLCLKIIYWGNVIPLGTIAFESRRVDMEKVAAAIVAATSVVIFFQGVRWRFKAAIALSVTLIFAFATSTWTISSQGLWQHGPINLLIVSLTLAFLKAKSSSTEPSKAFWLIIAGLVCGLLPGMRPTSLLYVGVALLWCGFYFRKKVMLFAVATIFSAAPAMWWNQYYFGDPIKGGYRVVQFLYNIESFPSGFAGLIVSPSRGILVYTPVVLFALPGCWRLLRSKKQPIDTWILGLFIAGFGLIANYACILTWSGGNTYGPRFLTDAMPAVCWMLAYWLQLRGLSWHRPAITAKISLIGFVAAAIYSSGVQFLGVAADYRGYGHWHETPISVTTIHGQSRFWSWTDSQITRSIQSIIHRRQQDQIMKPGYYTDSSSRILAVYDQRYQQRVNGPIVARPSEEVECKIVLNNQGSKVWYGYKNGLWGGEIVVQGTMHNALTNSIVGTAEFVLESRTAPGQSGEAIGLFIAPPIPGTYRLTLEVAVRNAISGLKVDKMDVLVTVAVPSQ